MLPVAVAVTLAEAVALKVDSSPAAVFDGDSGGVVEPGAACDRADPTGVEVVASTTAAAAPVFSPRGLLVSFPPPDTKFSKLVVFTGVKRVGAETRREPSVAEPLLPPEETPVAID